jgi:hypothetical protein
VASAAAGAAYVAAGLCTRFGVYNAGVAAARDPKYVVIPQKAGLINRPRGNAGP